MGDLEQTAIERLRFASKMSLKLYQQPLIITYSGGKDSQVILELAKRSGIPFEVMNNHTTADAPETVYFIREQFKKLENEGIKAIISYPKYKGKPTSMWHLISSHKIPPMRHIRYCCQVLKEYGGENRFIATGVRWAESIRRANNRGEYEVIGKSYKDAVILFNDNAPERRLTEDCKLKAKRVVNPIIDWSDANVWDYINSEKLDTNPLYSCGWHRVGCIGCPMAGTKTRLWEFAQYPKYEVMYKSALKKMIETHQFDRNMPWKTVDECWHWWLEDGVIAGQIEMDLSEVMQDV